MPVCVFEAPPAFVSTTRRDALPPLTARGIGTFTVRDPGWKSLTVREAMTAPFRVILTATSTA